MTNIYTRRFAGFLHAVGLCGGHVAQHDSKKPDISGTWNLSATGDHVVQIGLVLKQDDSKLTGTLMMPGRDIQLEGTFTDGALTLEGNMGKAEDNGGHASGPFTLTAKVQEDGTLAGKMGNASGQGMSWTAARLRKPKQQQHQH